MNIALFNQKLDFFNRFTGLIKEGGYKNNFLLPDLFDLIKETQNYSLGDIKQKWSEHINKIREGKAKNNINFYVHIPFCRGKCNYCMYPSKKLGSEEEIIIYIKKLSKQMSQFGKTFQDIRFKSLYIGGGTPSILRMEQIKKILAAIFENFNFETKGEKTFECNPDSITSEKLRLIRDFDFNRISLGVQTLDKSVLKSENRGYQEYAQIKKVVSDIKKLGFEEINVDLIIGLYKDGVKTILDSILKIADLEPDFISLYPLQPTTEYIQNYYYSDEEAFYKELNNKIRSLYNKIIKGKMPLNYGLYRPTLDNPRTASPWFFPSTNYKKMKFTYSYDSQNEGSCFALGEFSCSYIFNSCRYRQNGYVFDGIEISRKEQKLRYVMNGLAYDEAIDLEDYRKRFNMELAEDFKKEISDLEKMGKIEIMENKLKFLPKGPKQRFIYSLFFFDLEGIARKFEKLVMNVKQRNQCYNLKLGDKCNNHCISCFAREKLQVGNMQLKDQVKEALSSNFKEISFTGGEPTLYYNVLLKLMTLFQKKGFELSIVTNGRLFSIKKVTDEVIKKGLKKFTISVHGYKEVNDDLTNIKGGYKQILRAVDNIMGHEAVSVMVQSVCMQKNFDSIPLLMQDLSKRGIKRFNLQGVLPKGAALNDYRRFKIDYKKFRRNLDKIFLISKKFDLKVSFEFLEPYYFEAFPQFIPDKLDIFYYLSEFYDCADYWDYFLDCSKNLCSFCFMEGVCSRYKRIIYNKKKDDKEIETLNLNKFNLLEVKERLKHSRKKIMLNLIEPFYDIEDYRLLVPKLSSLKGIFKELNKEVIVRNIPQCIINGGGIKHVKQDYNEEFSKDKKEILRYICRTRKTKSMRCNKCIYNANCEGIFVDYAKIYGFDELEPHLRKSQSKMKIR